MQEPSTQVEQQEWAEKAFELRGLREYVPAVYTQVISAPGTATGKLFIEQGLPLHVCLMFWMKRYENLQWK